MVMITKMMMFFYEDGDVYDYKDDDVYDYEDADADYNLAWSYSFLLLHRNNDKVLRVLIRPGIWLTMLTGTVRSLARLQFTL